MRNMKTEKCENCEHRLISLKVRDTFGYNPMSNFADKQKLKGYPYTHSKHPYDNYNVCSVKDCKCAEPKESSAEIPLPPKGDSFLSVM